MKTLLFNPLNKRVITIILGSVFFLFFVTLTSVSTFIAISPTSPRYSQPGVITRWISSSLGFMPRNITAELVRIDSARWRQILEDERINSKFYSKKEIEEYAGFDGRFTDVSILEPGPYLSNYENPCWYEELKMSQDALYSKNCLMKRGAQFSRLTRKMLDINREKIHQQEEYMKGLGRSWRLRCLPKVFLIGADKCGTSAMTLYIQDHPLMAKGAFKEIRYWTNFIKTCLSPLSDYADMYDKAAERIRERIIAPSVEKDLPYHPCMALDPTPSTYKQYVCQGYEKYHHGCSGQWLSVAYVIKKLIPDAKILAMVRNPIDRVYSSYYFTSSRHDNRTVDENSFDEDVREFLKIYSDCVKANSVELCASGRGYGTTITDQQRTVFLGAIYSVHFRHFLSAFGSNIKVIALEDFAADPRHVRDDIFNFLNIPGVPRFYNRGLINKGPDKNPMLMKTRLLLNEFFRPFNNDLQDMFGISYDY